MMNNATFDLGDAQIRVHDPIARTHIALVLKGDHNLQRELEFPISGFPRCFSTEDSQKRKLFRRVEESAIILMPISTQKTLCGCR